jgi:hypothetical protein
MNGVRDENAAVDALHSEYDSNQIRRNMKPIADEADIEFFAGELSPQRIIVSMDKLWAPVLLNPYSHYADQESGSTVPSLQTQSAVEVR